MPQARPYGYAGTSAHLWVRTTGTGPPKCRACPHGRACGTRNSNTMHIPYRRRGKKPQKVPRHGNIRRGQDLWPKNVFQSRPSHSASSTSRRGGLSFLQARRLSLTYLTNAQLGHGPTSPSMTRARDVGPCPTYGSRPRISPPASAGHACALVGGGMAPGAPRTPGAETRIPAVVRWICAGKSVITPGCFSLRGLRVLCG